MVSVDIFLLPSIFSVSPCTYQADEDDDVTEGAISREKTQTRGIFATLKLVKMKGDIKEKNTIVYAGRANDEKPTLLDNIGDRVKIDHRDKMGRLLTPKEVWTTPLTLLYMRCTG